MSVKLPVVAVHKNWAKSVMFVNRLHVFLLLLIKQQKQIYVLYIMVKNINQKIYDNVKHELSDDCYHPRKNRFNWKKFNDDNGRFHNVLMQSKLEQWIHTKQIKLFCLKKKEKIYIFSSYLSSACNIKFNKNENKWIYIKKKSTKLFFSIRY